MGPLLGGEECFLDYGSWRGGLLRDDFVGAEDVVPGPLLVYGEGGYSDEAFTILCRHSDRPLAHSPAYPSRV